MEREIKLPIIATSGVVGSIVPAARIEITKASEVIRQDKEKLRLDAIYATVNFVKKTVRELNERRK